MTKISDDRLGSVLAEFEGYDKHGCVDDTLTAARLLAKAVRELLSHRASHPPSGEAGEVKQLKWAKIKHPHRPAEADYEAELLRKRLARMPSAAVETLTTWALMQPDRGSFAGALWALAEYVQAALPTIKEPTDGK
jgi:hypothetical protein